MSTKDAWWEDVALPLYAALDEATDLADTTSIDDRWKLVMDKCPWLVDRCTPAPPTVSVDIGFDDSEVWHPLASSNLDAWREAVKVLDGEIERAGIEVRFKSGVVYRYWDVPSAIIAGLVDSASPGGYFAAEIKDKFPTEKVA